MEPSAPEFAHIRAENLQIAGKCNGCGKLLKQAIRNTIPENSEVYDAPGRRDLMFIAVLREAKKCFPPGRYVYSDGILGERRRWALYCEGVWEEPRLEQKEFNLLQ